MEITFVGFKMLDADLVDQVPWKFPMKALGHARLVPRAGFGGSGFATAALHGVAFGGRMGCGARRTSAAHSATVWIPWDTPIRIAPRATST